MNAYLVFVQGKSAPPPPPDPHLRPLSLPSLATLTSASCVITGSQAMWCPMQPVVHTYVTLIHREVDSGTGFSDGQPTRPDENKEADSRTPPCGLSTTSQLSTTFVACTATVLISVDIAGVLSSSNSCRWAVTKPCRWGIRVVPSSPILSQSSRDPVPNLAEKRPGELLANPTMDHRAIVAHIGKLWAALSELEKTPFVAGALRDKQRIEKSKAVWCDHPPKLPLNACVVRLPMPTLRIYLPAVHVRLCFRVGDILRSLE